MDEPEILQLRFDPNTIDDLGAKLYSTLPPIISELIANGYDAGASKIYIDLNDKDPKNKAISIKDNGSGMSLKQINAKYLVVGRKRREENETHDPIYNRPVMGKKGIGKLSFFGITDHATITTIQDGKKVIFEMNHEKIKGSKEYFPEHEMQDTEEENGTIVELKKVKREEAFDFQGLKNSIANYFLFDEEFKVYIKYNNDEYEEITNETRYQQWDMQFSWEFPHAEYPYSQTIKGKLFTTKKPISKKLRGVALLSRKKLVNLPALFPVDSSSYFYSYLAGYLEVDFIDDLPDDVISTDRKTLNWGNPALNDFEKWLENTMKKLERNWRIRWAEAKKAAIRSNPGIKAKEETIRSEEERADFDKAIDSFAESDIDTAAAVEVMTATNSEYPEFQHRHLHTELAEETYECYQKESYYEAVIKGVKLYIKKLRYKVNEHRLDEEGVINYAFGLSDLRLDVIGKFKKISGDEFTDNTKKSIRMGQLLLSQAIFKAFRNPIIHEEEDDLSESRLYTEKDCLDALSLLSHLFRRLDNAEI